MDNADFDSDDLDSDGGEAAALISLAFDDDTAIAKELVRGRRAITANRRLKSEAARLREQLTEQRTRADTAEARANAAVSNAHAQRLKDEIARLLVKLSEQRTRTESAETRAEAAETRLGKVHQAVATANAKHRATVAEVQRDHANELLELRGEHRRVSAETHTAHAAHVTRLMREHAARMEQVLSRRLADLVGLPGRVTSRAAPDPRVAVDAVGQLVAAAVAELVDQLKDLAPGMAPLTDRETVVMRAAARGLESDEMATEIGISRKVVINILGDVYGKLGARNRAAAIATCLALGWLDVLDLGPELFPDVLDDDGAVDPARLCTRMMPLSRCSDRDWLVLTLLARGGDNAVIKDKLGMSEKAVRHSTKRVLGAIGARNRFHAVAILHYLAAVSTAPDPVRADEAGDSADDGSPAEPTPPPMVAVEPTPAPVVDPGPAAARTPVVGLSKRDRARWRAHVREMVMPDDADPTLVTIYNTLTAHQQFTFKALAAGMTEPHVATALHVSLPIVERHIRLMCKRFKEDSSFGLAVLGRDLFKKENKRIDYSHQSKEDGPAQVGEEARETL